MKFNRSTTFIATFGVYAAEFLKQSRNHRTNGRTNRHTNGRHAIFMFFKFLIL